MRAWSYFQDYLQFKKAAISVFHFWHLERENDQKMSNVNFEEPKNRRTLCTNNSSNIEDREIKMISWDSLYKSVGNLNAEL